MKKWAVVLLGVMISSQDAYAAYRVRRGTAVLNTIWVTTRRVSIAKRLQARLLPHVVSASDVVAVKRAVVQNHAEVMPIFSEDISGQENVQRALPYSGDKENIQKLQESIYLQDLPEVYTLVMRQNTPVDDCLLTLAKEFLKDPRQVYSKYKPGMWLCSEQVPSVNDHCTAEMIHRILRMGQRLKPMD